MVILLLLSVQVGAVGSLEVQLVQKGKQVQVVALHRHMAAIF